jgi:hypothetical protein
MANDCRGVRQRCTGHRRDSRLDRQLGVAGQVTGALSLVRVMIAAVGLPRQEPAAPIDLGGTPLVGGRYLCALPGPGHGVWTSLQSVWTGLEILTTSRHGIRPMRPSATVRAPTTMARSLDRHPPAGIASCNRERAFNVLRQALFSRLDLRTHTRRPAGNPGSTSFHLVQLSGSGGRRAGRFLTLPN